MTDSTRAVKHGLGPVEDFEPGEFRIFEIAGRSIGVVNTGNAFHAVLNVCPHELAPVCAGTLSGTMLPSDPGEVKYGLEGQILRCPWHGWEFDLEDGGRAAFSRYRARIRLFPVTIEDGQVMVEVTERRLRDTGRAGRASAAR